MNFDLQLYWALFLRRLPVMALFVLIGVAGGIVAAFKLPETYETSARLLVEAPQIPDNMVVSTVQTGATEQLDIIEQRLLTRANLIDIANRFRVFPDIRQMEPDAVVSKMRSSTRIRRSAGREQATLMTISFSSHSGRIAADVVNEYVTLVLQENARFRTSRAESTLSFFEQEVQRLGQELDRQSTAIATFKSENAEALPEEQSYRLGRQTLLQERLSRLERDLRALQSQRQDFLRIFETTGRISSIEGIGRRRSPEEERLIVARAELENARSVYSDQSPRVIRLQAMVDRLEAVVAAQTAAGLTGEGGEVSPEQALLDATLSQIDNQIATLDSDIADTTEELDGLQRAISQSAANGIQLASLERDYQMIQTRYNAAVANLNQARMSERIESTAQGQRVSVIENASVPQVPTGPNRSKVAALGAVAGIGLAAAYFVLLELLNRNIRSPGELTGRFNITPITTIPHMRARDGRLVRRRRLLGVSFVLATALLPALWSSPGLDRSQFPAGQMPGATGTN
ncbi:GumC family protein [Rhodovulum steppense]|uniref:Polysaccharide chain length determinant protein (PEP-CTERM system associated) n=1 Tax=Rhodovulum steppense TaxID=540251 RepID=A0A4R1YMJ7_9RHOB|nr:chain length-determining protein [Rhodovulum steppense]TCM78979.1 polysaccharide chain length determinant protein (PEP-CTERM system associated) [Rhodovulum steppense]